MNHRVLIVGSGGREHAIAHKIADSNRCEALYVAPGNAGTTEIALNLNIGVDQFTELGQACLEHNITMLIVGPEVPLVKGIVDFFHNDPSLSSILVVGPDAVAAQLEGSKDFAKAFMQKHGVPTAAYQTFTSENIQEGYKFLESLNSPYVLKADGLAAGKGVLILDKLADAKNELAQFLTHNSFGEAGQKVVIEEFLDGIECSCFVLVDNTGSYQILPLAKDYKRIGEGDTGLNTGGMGAISPVPFVDEQLFEKIENEVVKPTVSGVKAENYNYKGIIFIGLMVVKGKPYVIEYNVRMGDPETEVVFPRIESDVVDLFEAIAQGTLSSVELSVNPQTAAAVIAVSGGYPEAYEKNKKIKGLEQVTESIVFHAGTVLKEGEVLTSGGRVLALTSFGKDKDEALAKSYNSLSHVKFDKMNYRKDIGFDL